MAELLKKVAGARWDGLGEVFIPATAFPARLQKEWREEPWRVEGYGYRDGPDGPGFHVTALKDTSKATDLPPLLDDRTFWLYGWDVYVTEDPLQAADVEALVDEGANRRRLRLEKAHALRAMTQQLDEKRKREPIPQEVKIAIWQRDGGRCLDCGVQTDLEFDHIIPLAMGGANSMRNLQLLCGTCNRRKGATLA